MRCFYLGEKYISDLVIDASERLRVLTLKCCACCVCFGFNQWPVLFSCSTSSDKEGKIKVILKRLKLLLLRRRTICEIPTSWLKIRLLME